MAKNTQSLDYGIRIKCPHCGDANSLSVQVVFNKFHKITKCEKWSTETEEHGCGNLFVVRYQFPEPSVEAFKIEGLDIPK